MTRASFMYAAIYLSAVIPIAECANCCDESKCRNAVVADNLSAASADEYECKVPLLLANNNTAIANSSLATTEMIAEDAFNCSDGYEGYPIQNETAKEEGTQYYTCCQPKKRLTELAIILILGCLSLGFTLVLVLGILRSKKYRSQPFNLYLVFLYIPSLIYIVKVDVNIFRQLFACFIPGLFPNIWTFSFYFQANILLNAVIAYDVYGILRSSKKCLRIRPLPLKTVYMRVAVVYILSVASAIWRTHVPPGVDFSYPPRAAFYAFTCITCVMPILFVVYICIRVWKDKLLPLNGETRALAFFFIRIAVVFFGVWIPIVIAMQVLITKFKVTAKFDLTFFTTHLLSIGGEIISAVLAMTKPDVRHSVKSLLCCGNCDMQWKRRRMQPVTEESSEQISRTEPEIEGNGGIKTKNAMKMSNWHRPDDFGDNVARERYSICGVYRGDAEDEQS